MLPSAQFWKCANSWRRNWRNRYQFESGLVFGFQTIIQRGNVGYWVTDPDPSPFANCDAIVCYGGAGLFDKHLASTIHFVDDEIIGWLQAVNNASAPAP
jgi:hypothetical protein